MISKGEIRLHLLAILTAMTVFGAIFNRLLLKFGFDDLADRNFFVMTASYISFFAFIKMWLNFLSRDVYRLKDAAHLKEDRVKDEQSSGSWWNILNFDSPEISGEAAAFFAVIIVIILLILVGAWISIEGPTILIDAAFDASLSVSLIRASSNLVSGNWQGGVFKRTIWPFLLMLVLSTLIITIMTLHCPNAIRLSDALHQCGQHKQVH
jgi:hypothetical protein